MYTVEYRVQLYRYEYYGSTLIMVPDLTHIQFLQFTCRYQYRITGTKYLVPVPVSLWSEFNFSSRCRDLVSHVRYRYRTGTGTVWDRYRVFDVLIMIGDYPLPSTISIRIDTRCARCADTDAVRGRGACHAHGHA